MVEEAEQEVLVLLSSEEVLETPVDEGVDAVGVDGFVDGGVIRKGFVGFHTAQIVKR